MADVKSVEIPEPLIRLGEAFRDAGHELFLVGGYVRDALLDVPGLDLDATTDAQPKEIKALLRPHDGHLWSVGERFGTVGARIGGYDVEVTTYRTDLYTQGSRHPEVTFGESLEEDLARRDFTINAIAADAVSGGILDPFGGREDLGPGIIRPVGDPLDRMRDDPLRMLRAVRFETTLSTPEKPFAMTPELEAAILENAGWLESISAERIREEFEKILVSENVAAGLRTLVRLGLMQHIVPEFMETLSVEQEAEFPPQGRLRAHPDSRLERGARPGPPQGRVFPRHRQARTLVYEHRCTFCGAKSTRKTTEEGECDNCGGRTVPKKIHFYGHENVGAKIARRAMGRLAYSRDDIDAVGHLVAQHMRPMSYAVGRDPWSDSAVRRFIRDTHLVRGDRELANVDTLLKLARADITGSAPRRRQVAVESWNSLKDRVDEIREKDQIEKLQSPLDGNDLMELFGRPPGRWIKPIKDYLEGEVIEGRLSQNDTEKARELAESYARENNIFEED